MSNRIRIYLKKSCDNGTKNLLIKAFDNGNDSTFSSVKKATITKDIPKNFRYNDPPSKHATKKGADLYLSGMDRDDGRIYTLLEFKKKNTEITVDLENNSEAILKILIARRVVFMIERMDVSNLPFYASGFANKYRAYLTPIPQNWQPFKNNTRPDPWK